MTPIQLSHYSHLPPSDGLHVQVSPCPRTMLFKPCYGGSHGRGDQHNHRPQLEFCGSTHDGNVWASPPTTMNEKSTRERDLISNRDSSKWTPCKMRFMRRRMNSNALAATNPRTIQLKLQDQQQAIAGGNTSSSSNDNHSHHHGVPNCVVRVCSDCNTTKTPLWRSGPRGPKSLCNACGIRRIRKTRRAMTATALTSGFIPAAPPAAQARKEKGPDSEPRTVPFKKRCKFDHSPQGKLQLEDFATSLSKNQAFKRVFPQDEREAAVLLMALSCGLIHG